MKFKKGEKAASIVEYALLLIVVAAVFFALFILFGPVIQGIFTSINQALASAGS